MNMSLQVPSPSSYDVDGPLTILVVYGSRGLCKESVASVYRANDTSQLASLLNAIALDMAKSREITQIIFLDKKLEMRYSLDESIERGWIDLPVEWTDEYSETHRLV